MLYNFLMKRFLAFTYRILKTYFKAMTKLESGILASKPKPKLLSKTELKSSIPKPRK